MIKSSNDEFLKELGLQALMRRQWHSMSREQRRTFALHGRVRVMLDLPMSASMQELSGEADAELGVVHAIDYHAVGRHEVLARCLGVEYLL